MARNEVTVNVQLDDKQLKSLADEIRETFAKRIEELESRIAKLREICNDRRAESAFGSWADVEEVWPSEILAVLDGEGEKAAGGVLKPGEVYVVGESGCSLPHMPLPKGGIPTGRKVTIHVRDAAMSKAVREVLDLGDSTEDAAYDNPKIADEKPVEYREPDCWIDDHGRMQCNKCKDQVLAFKDGGWACECDSAMFEHAKPDAAYDKEAKS